jgi:hypothetical protein
MTAHYLSEAMLIPFNITRHIVMSLKAKRPRRVSRKPGYLVKKAKRDYSERYYKSHSLKLQDVETMIDLERAGKM